MKYYHLILTLVLALPTIALAKEKGTNATTDVEPTVKKIEQEILDGILKSDTSALEKYLSNDYLGIGPDGATQNKSEFLSDVKSGTLKLESSKYSDMKVQVADADMAVVVYRSNDKGTYKGKDITASIAGSMFSLSAMGNGRSRSIRALRSRNHNGAFHPAKFSDVQRVVSS